MDDDLTALANPEEAFFEHGYKDGYAHGRIHGLIEGRAAGKEKGLELWEEVGYYRGFAMLWKAVHTTDDADQSSSRIIHHINLLLSTIERFPLVNPKPLPTSEERESEGAADSDEQLDVTKLLSQIRSRYKVLCSTIGVPAPRLRAMATGEYSLPLGDTIDLRPTSTRSSKRNSVWDLDNEGARPQPLEL